jgi:hypothetical protein
MIMSLDNKEFVVVSGGFKVEITGQVLVAHCFSQSRICPNHPYVVINGIRFDIEGALKYGPQIRIPTSGVRRNPNDHIVLPFFLSPPAVSAPLTDK